MNFDFHELILLGTVIVIGYYIGLSTRRVKLPSLIGYMILGVVLGTSGLNILKESGLDRLSFISEITLAFVAFLIGAELSLSSLKRLGFGIVAIIFAESFYWPFADVNPHCMVIFSGF